MSKIMRQHLVDNIKIIKLIIIILIFIKLIINFIIYYKINNEICSNISKSGINYDMTWH